MHGLILWCGFLGAWLLVAGPVYQAGLELREHDIKRDELEAVISTVPQPKPISGWWWILPPLYLVLERRRSDQFQAAVMSSLTREQRESLVTFIDKATGWGMVGLGGLLIAVKETWELSDHNEWGNAVFCVLAVVMLGAGVLHAAVRTRRTQSVLAGGDDGGDTSAE